MIRLVNATSLILVLCILSISVVDGKKKKKEVKKVVEEEDAGDGTELQAFDNELQAAVLLIQQLLEYSGENTDPATASTQAFDFADLADSMMAAMPAGMPEPLAEVVDFALETFTAQCVEPNIYIDPFPYKFQPTRLAYIYSMVEPADLKDTMVTDTEPPTNLQGLFWLRNPDGTLGVSDQVVSFAQTREPGGLNSGSALTTGGYAYRIRVNGDRQWASVNPPLWRQALVSVFDVKYHLELLSGELDDPTKFRIVPDVNLPGTCLRAQAKECLEMIFNLELTLQNTPGTGNGNQPSAEFPTSVVWRRDSTYGATADTYEVIQIVDGAGVPLQPAYDQLLYEIGDQDFQVNNLFSPDLPQICAEDFAV